jgi:hypothetical protein
MQDYREFPPIKYFIRALKTCPRSAMLYLQIWKSLSNYMTLVVPKRDVRKLYLISPTIFRNMLTPLMYLNLLRFSETDEDFHIDISGSYVNE